MRESDTSTSALLVELERQRRRLAGSASELERARRHLLKLAVWGLHRRFPVDYLAEASGLPPDEIVDAHRTAVATGAPEVTREWVLRDGVLHLPNPVDDSHRWRIR
jgi:hypothetical protein